MAEASIDKLYSDEPEFGDFFALLKPRVMSLVVGSESGVRWRCSVL